MRFLGLLLCLATPLAAADLPQSKQTGLGLYLTAEETATFLAQTPGTVMIDVRTPQEIDESGMAEGVDALIPLTAMNAAGQTMFNPDFMIGMKALAMARGLGPSDPIVIICRSGNRSAVAADALAQVGFENVYTVTDGYLGDRGVTGQRNVNGWRNAGLPWQERAGDSCAPAAEGGAC